MLYEKDRAHALTETKTIFHLTWYIITIQCNLDDNEKQASSDGEIQLEGTTLESFHLWEICAEQLGATSIDIDIYAEIKVEELTLEL